MRRVCFERLFDGCRERVGAEGIEQIAQARHGRADIAAAFGEAPDEHASLRSSSEESIHRAPSSCLGSALGQGLDAFGESTKEWVFDNAKPLRLSRYGVVPIVLHRYLRDLVADYNAIPTFCAPRSGNQKGSVERLVGYAKHGFLFARKSLFRADLEVQLRDWPHEVNHVRPSDATGVIPEVARQDELRWLGQRPVQCNAADHALREDAVVAPTGTVSVRGTAYFASARRIGAPATIAIRARENEIVLFSFSRSRC